MPLNLFKIIFLYILFSQSIDLAQFTPQFIRNFCIIAHIDHGKSTLSDRFLEIAGHLQKEDKAKQYLDKLLVEKKKGITIKAQSCSLVVNHKNNQYLLNLVDTPVLFYCLLF